MTDRTKSALWLFWMFAAATGSIILVLCAHGAEPSPVDKFVEKTAEGIYQRGIQRGLWSSNSIPDPSVVSIVQTVTNWTGVITQGRELGYLTTNHDLRVVYQKTTNTIQAKRELSSVAVWREPIQQTFGTNSFVWTNGIIYVR